MKRFATIVCFFLLILAGAQAMEQNRQILALYDDQVNDMLEPKFTDIHQMIEMPLNQLGMVVTYHNLNQRPLPDASEYRAVVIWTYRDAVKDPVEYIDWLSAALSNDTRLLVFNGFGAAADLDGTQVPETKYNALLQDFGLVSNEEIDDSMNPFTIERKDLKPEFFQLETELPPSMVYYKHFTSPETNTVVWRSLTRKDVPDSESIAIAIMPKGGFVSNDSEMYRAVSSPFHQRFWDMDIFAFLEAALDCKGMLRPDVTTVDGCRAAYSHIDGDGIVNYTQDQGDPVISSKKLYEEVLSKYPVPITMGTIVGRVDTNAVGTAVAIETARRIHALPNLQGAVHGYAHMFKWYEEIPGLDWPGRTFSPEFETVDAINFLNENIMPEGQTANVMQWTGDCLPQEECLAICDANDILNINGGDSRYDSQFRSLSNISSLWRSIGSHRQIYTSAQNENLYTGLWTTNFGGYRQVIETFERSESPRRLLPVNVYYHVYSGERQASLDAVKDVYNWCLKQPLCWITTAEYIQMVHAFADAKVGLNSNETYWAENYDSCTTMRLDNCPHHVDMNTAVNVAGFTHTNGALYVTLKKGNRAAFALTADTPTTLCLNRSTALLRNISGDKTHWQAEARLFAPGFIALQGADSDSAGLVSIGNSTNRIAAGKHGRINIRLPQGTGQWETVSCRITQ